MIDVEKFQQVIESKNLENIIKASKEMYKYLLFGNNYTKLYCNIFSDLDYKQILEVPILYIIYCKLLKYNNKKSKLKEVLADCKNLNLTQKSVDLDLSFDSNILLLEAYVEKYNDCNELSLKKLEKALKKLTNYNDYPLLSEINYEIGSIYFNLFRTSEALVSYKKSEYYVLNDTINNAEIILKIKVSIANCILVKNRLSECFEEVQKIEFFIAENNLSKHQYLIFYYNILNRVLFYKNKKSLLLENFDKLLDLFEDFDKLPAFIPYINTAKHLIHMNELEKSKVFINKIEKHFSLIESPKQARIFLYSLNALFLEKINDIETFKIWLKEIEPTVKNNYETDYGLGIFYAYAMLKVGNITEAEKISKKITEFFSKKDAEMFKQKSEILKIAIDYKKGNKNQAIFQLKEKLFFFQKDWNVGIFLESSDIILNMINQIYLDSLNKKTLMDINYLEDIVSFIDEKNKLNNSLSEKELEVLILMAEKKSNQAIANTLFISLNTVKTHIKNITKKLNVNNKNDAVMKAKEYLIF